jgi:uncharacterized membrane protein
MQAIAACCVQGIWRASCATKAIIEDKSIPVNQRPRLKALFTASDRFFEILAFLVLAILWAYCLATYFKLPDSIPTHFNFKGEVDAYGSKTTFWILPGVATFLYCILTAISFFPWTFNFPVKITPENAFRQYTLAVRMLRFLKLVVGVIFTVILLQIARAVQGDKNGLGTWFLTVFLGTTLILLVMYLFLALRGK